MKRKLTALLILLAVPVSAWAQDAGAPAAREFYISSLNTPFAVQGEFRGEYRVYPGRIEVRVTEAELRVSEHCPYKGRRLLSALRFALATNTDAGRWKVTNGGQEFALGQVVRPGDTLGLGEIYFHVPIDDSVDLSKHWLVVQVGDVALDIPGKSREGYAFAHSRRDIFSRVE